MITAKEARKMTNNYIYFSANSEEGIAEAITQMAHSGYEHAYFLFEISLGIKTKLIDNGFLVYTEYNPTTKNTYTVVEW